MHNGSPLLLPDAGQAKAQQSYPKDHPGSNPGPMSIASPTTGADGRLNWEAVASSGRLTARPKGAIINT
jgi:hypothetical protein